MCRCSGYKGQRPETPEAIRTAIPRLHTILQAMAIHQIQARGPTGRAPRHRDSSCPLGGQWDLGSPLGSRLPTGRAVPTLGVQGDTGGVG